MGTGESLARKDTYFVKNLVKNGATRKKYVKKITKNARKMTACFISFEENFKSKKE